MTLLFVPNDAPENTQFELRTGTRISKLSGTTRSFDLERRQGAEGYPLACITRSDSIWGGVPDGAGNLWLQQWYCAATTEPIEKGFINCPIGSADNGRFQLGIYSIAGLLLAASEPVSVPVASPGIQILDFAAPFVLEVGTRYYIGIYTNQPNVTVSGRIDATVYPMPQDPMGFRVNNSSGLPADVSGSFGVPLTIRQWWALE